MKELFVCLIISIGLSISLNAYSQQQANRIPEDRYKMEVVKMDSKSSNRKKPSSVPPQSNDMDKIKEGVNYPIRNATKPVPLNKENRFEMEKRKEDASK
jgi:hypothetical protein